MPNEPLLTAPAAARYLGINVRHLRRLVDRRAITFHDVAGRVMFVKAELDAFLERIRVEATS